MPTNHAQYHFSITVHTVDVAVLHCLRALCQHWAGGPYPQMGWGGSDQVTWKVNNNNVVLRFASDTGRASFLKDAQRLLAGYWSEVSRKDDDPASQRR